MSVAAAAMPGLVLVLAATVSAQVTPSPPERGITETLARARAAAIRDLRYELRFVVPSDRRQAIEGRVAVRFTLAAPQDVVLDFAQPRGNVRSLRVQDADVPFEAVNGHLVVPAASTRPGDNEIAVEFTAGDDAFNRNDDFLYTLFVPARAHLAFPVFDQPNLKARYTLSLEVPATWQALANGAVEHTETFAGRTRIRFAETPPLPTYLFSFTAGRFAVESASRAGRTYRMLHRETDAAKVARNREAIFDLHAAALAWLEDYTAIPYPWGKFDFALIPSFQFGGMEHAGAILYNSASLMLDESATQNQMLDRASLIAHETAHMWFGDLVTMDWFDDVWMKEVFANVMAAKIVNPSFPDVNHELRFLLAHYPLAYQIDRTGGANPIRQQLGNLNDAGQLYGAIIYQKAPIVMRQLERMLGETAFRDGLREYLKVHAYGNATWLDLVRILDARSPDDVAAWSHAWVEERGRPEFATTLEMGPDGLVSALSMTVRDPLGRGISWPQRLQLALGHPGSVELVPASIGGDVVEVREAAGRPAPLYVLPNGAGIGYGLFLLDDRSRRYLLDHVEDIPDPLTRGAAWVTLWDSMLSDRVVPAALVDALSRALPLETDEQNAQRMLGYLTRAFWRHLTPVEREDRGPRLEGMLRTALDRASTSSRKSAWFNAYRDVVQSREGVAWMTRVWRRDEKVPGLTLAEPDEIAMALELAVREAPGWREILATQRDRTQNPDRKARFEFVIPALSADPAERERAFARFRQVENRRREPWVLEAMAYLNHPLREAHARRFVAPGLELLREIQQTGDIFFPTRWMDVMLSGHRSPEIAGTVRSFLARQPDYPERLRWTILSSADELFRIAAR